MFRGILIFITGALAGLATGLLTAPSSGKKTRKQISQEFDSTRNSLEEAANLKLEEAKSLLNKTVERQAEVGKNAIDKAKKAVSL